MDRDLSLEKHLLSRSYTSDLKILELLEDRYSINGGQRPFLPLTPFEQEVKEKPQAETEIGLNPERKPKSERKASARRDMRVYIKLTLANQKKATKKLQQFARKHPTAPIRVGSLLKQYKIPKYDDYVKLNELWGLYIENLLFGDQKNPNLNMVLPKLSTADFNGSKLTVLELRNPHLVGLTGIVLFDAQHLFILVVPQVTEAETNILPSQAIGGIRIAAKRGTMFAFDVKTGEETVGFTILGSRFEFRAVDRSARKFKSHDVGDIY